MNDGKKLRHAWLLMLLLGCNGNPIGPEICNRPESEEPTDFRGGTLENGIYQSADWDGELLHFPGGAYYRIHHQLGETPKWWQVYLSFERDGLNSASLAPAAGNQAEVKAIDEESLVLLNGSCVDYWVLITMGAGSSTDS